MVIADKLRLLREQNHLSQGDIEKRILRTNSMPATKRKLQADFNNLGIITKVLLSLGTSRSSGAIPNTESSSSRYLLEMRASWQSSSTYLAIRIGGRCGSLWPRPASR
jgi:hypothetical protein